MATLCECKKKLFGSVTYCPYCGINLSEPKKIIDQNVLETSSQEEKLNYAGTENIASPQSNRSNNEGERLFSSPINNIPEGNPIDSQTNNSENYIGHLPTELHAKSDIHVQPIQAFNFSSEIISIIIFTADVVKKVIFRIHELSKRFNSKYIIYYGLSILFISFLLLQLKTLFFIPLPSHVIQSDSPLLTVDDFIGEYAGIVKDWNEGVMIEYIAVLNIKEVRTVSDSSQFSFTLNYNNKRYDGQGMIYLDEKIISINNYSGSFKYQDRKIIISLKNTSKTFLLEGRKYIQ